MPEDMKSEVLKKKAYDYGKERGIQLEWFEEVRGPFKTAEALCKLVLHADTDFVAIGSTGRKNHDDKTHIGSTGE